jgi:glycosyltransferase involved in cell wall biosynthesis
MEYKSWKAKVVRKLWGCFPTPFFSVQSSWWWLRLYPAVVPKKIYFKEWNQVESGLEWEDYQFWVDQYGLTTLDCWHQLHQRAIKWKVPPKISIITPVHNAQADVLAECVYSVRAQAYPYWQLILIDDHSSKEETLNFLKSRHCNDPRIQVLSCNKPLGISKASNLGINKAKGDYVVFLDHDDRLALNALFVIAEDIQQHPKTDIIYSDRDMISPEGGRYMHLFKPNWSPETLLSGNYVFHLMCYRRSLLNELGGCRSELDGSQDYDLILRAAETQPNVRHVQQVLYHWRQHEGSVALDSNAKEYAFKAGVAALNQALRRRGIDGEAVEIASLWRGNYQLKLKYPKQDDIELVTVDSTLSADSYTQFINNAIEKSHSGKPFIAIISNVLTPITKNTLKELAAWLRIEGVGLASGSIATDSGEIEYVGATYTKEGELLNHYQGSPVSEAGYMAVTKLVRNISAPHPYCVVIRKEVWEELKGLDNKYSGYYGLLDFALRAQMTSWRCVSVPHAPFSCEKKGLLSPYSSLDRMLFCEKWQAWLDRGDPYYNVNLERVSQERLFHVKSKQLPNISK